MPNFKKQKIENKALKAQQKAEIKKGFQDFQKSLPPKTPLILAGLGVAACGFVFLKGLQSIIGGGKKKERKSIELSKKPNLFAEGAKEVIVSVTTDTAKKTITGYLEKLFLDEEKK